MINEEFSVHKVTDDCMIKMKTVAGIFNELLDTLKTICPESRCLSISKTKLEEACFFAKKSIASLPENHDGDR